MGFYERVILPRKIDLSCNSKPVSRQHQKVVPLAEGRMLAASSFAKANRKSAPRSIAGAFACIDNMTLAATAWGA